MDEVPINERRSISSHTTTEHGVYDDEPFPVEGLAYYWYQRAVYWKREAHRSEGTQQKMDFEKKDANSIGMHLGDYNTVRGYIHSGQFITAIKHVREVTNLGLMDAKERCEKIRADMGWNGKHGLDCKFTNY